MEGPTPVSALLHAATMVTVGVFCLIRCNNIFIKTPIILFYITIIGAITALFGSIVGVLQNDIKRVIAYSTCSQLGYMVLACGLTHFESALYHLTNHAFFKALLFLTAGALIHALNGKQDIREMGSLLKIQPILYISFLIGSVALMGLPYLSGYFSKDFILEYAFVNQQNVYSLFSYFLGILGAFFTSFYSGRLLFLSFISNIKNINKINIINLHILPIYIYVPLIILSLFSIFSG
jgi:NADH:ubiquinone oxidoreductase subunit 5 (subunit L)/multisubunit Na+/H+ antiporter MnhA subunit